LYFGASSRIPSFKPVPFLRGGSSTKVNAITCRRGQLAATDNVASLNAANLSPYRGVAEVRHVVVLESLGIQLIIIRHIIQHFLH